MHDLTNLHWHVSITKAFTVLTVVTVAVSCLLIYQSVTTALRHNEMTVTKPPVFLIQSIFLLYPVSSNLAADDLWIGLLIAD